ncbi:MAG: GDP-mannose 4,6-dehydratase [Sulfuricellaceae bacterium]|nr:GDP-mannose 4,6-dehydratase [Sulfuricellaceae bacterium]
MMAAKTRALICGVSGQDGAYLAKFLVGKGYEVFGTSRDAELSSFANLRQLGVLDRVHRRSMSLMDFRSVLTVLSEVQPSEIYNLAGQSSVGLSFEQPVETMESICMGTLNLLEAVRFLGKGIKLYNASSSECFGDTGDHPADEQTPFKPRSPYAVAKSAAHWTVANYRDAYGLFACNGILFNHESPLRPPRFVTRKIVRAACAIKLGQEQSLRLGNLGICRDWGSAEEYVDAMWRMLQFDRAEDFVIATGQTSSLQEFVKAAFDAVDLDWSRHVEFDNALTRPSETSFSAGNAAKASDALGWQAKSQMRDVVRMMVDQELASMSIG